MRRFDKSVYNKSWKAEVCVCGRWEGGGRGGEEAATTFHMYVSSTAYARHIHSASVDGARSRCTGNKTFSLLSGVSARRGVRIAEDYYG